VNIVLDACAIINLVNGSVFDTVLNLRGYGFFVGSQASGECGEATSIVLQQAIQTERVTVINDDAVTASNFLALLQQYGLGDGETESLTFTQSLGYMICTDDKRARLVSAELLGNDRVIGSLGLLKRAVQQQLLTASEAFGAYQKMKTAGGFLPEIDLSFFIRVRGTA
jgi:predicted nucleic acid-binding protein